MKKVSIYICVLCLGYLVSGVWQWQSLERLWQAPVASYFMQRRSMLSRCHAVPVCLNRWVDLLKNICWLIMRLLVSPFSHYGCDTWLLMRVRPNFSFFFTACFSQTSNSTSSQHYCIFLNISASKSRKHKSRLWWRQSTSAPFSSTADHKVSCGVLTSLIVILLPLQLPTCKKGPHRREDGNWWWWAQVE